MPVSISCPKCKAKYTLPDSLRGKPVKCKSCGATFRTQAAPAGAASGPDAVSQKDMKQFGISGQLTRAPEIFTTAPHQSPQPNVMGNFALQDPGFGDLEEIKRRMEKKATGKKEARPYIDLAPYGVARMGMTFIYYSLCYLILLGVATFGFGLFLQFVGNAVAETNVAAGRMEDLSVEEARRARFEANERRLSRVGANGEGNVMGMIVSVVLTVVAIPVPIAFIMLIVGQAMCLWAPNKNEKLAAGLVFGTIFVSFGIGVFMAILEGVFATGQAREAVGILGIGMSLASYALTLSSVFFFVMFYRIVGRNIKSKEMLASSKLSMIVWATSTVGAVVSTIVIIVVVAMFPGKPEAVLSVLKISVLFNFGLFLATACVIVVMVNSGVKETAIR